MQSASLQAGSATRNITPEHPCFLYGYPHIPRISTGTHDPLLATALALESAGETCLFVSVDVIFVSKQLTATIRDRVRSHTGIPGLRLLLSATHTHSGPVTLDYLSNEADPVVPKANKAYLRYLEDQIVDAACEAFASRRPAEVGFATADATGIGTCRHDPSGPCDLSVPVMYVRSANDKSPIGVVLVCAMHPTVLHEDSTLFSGDFPAFARDVIRQALAAPACPVIYHTGASGDQSPRHVTRGNTFQEANRLGEILGKAVAGQLGGMKFESQLTLASEQTWLDLPTRELPGSAEAATALEVARERFARLKRDGAPAPEVRSAECDMFGAEETFAIARAAEQGRVAEALRSCLPAEVQVLRVGRQTFVGWPGEFFVEFALAVKRVYPAAAIITLANGDLQGYVVTQQAVGNRWYEAGNALLKSPDAGHQIVAATLALLAKVNAHRASEVRDG